VWASSTSRWTSLQLPLFSFPPWRPCGTISMKSSPPACCNTQHKLPAFRCDLALRPGLVEATHALRHADPPSTHRFFALRRRSSTGTGDIPGLTPLASAGGRPTGLSILRLRVGSITASRNFMECPSIECGRRGGCTPTTRPHACPAEACATRLPFPNAPIPYGLLRPPLLFASK
jgi:hypothetical protein